MVTKEDMLAAIRALPPDASVDDAIEKLYLLQNVDRGITQAESGQTVSHDEARRRMAQWLQK